MATSPEIPDLSPMNNPMMLHNLPAIVSQVTDLYIEQIYQRSTMPTPEAAQLELLQYIQQEVMSENQAYRPKGQQLRAPETLPPTSIAKLANTLFSIYRIPCAGIDSDPKYDILGLYQTSGPDEGIYATSDLEFAHIMHRFNSLYKPSEFTQFKNILLHTVERCEPCHDKDLIAVNNGIFNYATKQLMPFDPRYVFLSKSRVDYNPAAQNVTIHNPDDNTDWDVESWMNELSDDPEIVQLLWEILGAIIRPNVPWNKSAWFYSETGNNGKGTLCALMRNLAGPRTCASISLADFCKDFMLEPLLRSSCIVVDENPVGEYIDKGGNLKAVITGDVLQINRKYEKAVQMRFRGFMVQCLNEPPRIKDKSESLYRRLLFVPFDKCFTGQERKYIKEDYLARPEVLQYVLYRVLNSNYYELSNPKACQDVLDSYKTYNDPLRQYVAEVFPELVWDFVPIAFLFDLYRAWFEENCPEGRLLGKQTFNLKILQMEIPGWTSIPTQNPQRPGPSMLKPEPLIMRYNLIRWKNQHYHGNDPGAIAIPTLKNKYSGCFIRVLTQAPDIHLLNDSAKLDPTA